MEVDDLLVHLGGSAVVDKQSNGNAQHEGYVAGEHVPDQHGNDGNGQDNVEEEQLGTGQLAGIRGSGADLQRLALGKTRAVLLLQNAGDHGDNESQNQAENLNRDQRGPQLAGFHTQHGSGTHGGAGPGHQVQNAHRQHGDAQQGGGLHVQLLVHGQHGGNHDAEGGSAAAVQVADGGNQAGHNAHTDDVVADELHQLADDGVKHSGIGHDAKVEDGEYEQGCGGGGGIETGLNHGCQIVEGEPAAQHQHQTQNRGEDDEGDGGLGLALEQGNDNRYDGHNTENANYGVAHVVIPLSLIDGLCLWRERPAVTKMNTYFSIWMPTALSVYFLRVSFPVKDGTICHCEPVVLRAANQNHL